MNAQQQKKPVIAHATDLSKDEIRKASKNFYVHELDCRDGTPVPTELVDGLVAYIQRNIQPIRDFFDCPTFIRSGYRHEAYNRAVGGAPRSYHRYGEIPGREGIFAVDLAVQGVEPIIVHQAILGLMRIGVIEPGGLGVYSWGVHYDNRGVITLF